MNYNNELKDCNENLQSILTTLNTNNNDVYKTEIWTFGMLDDGIEQKNVNLPIVCKIKLNLDNGITYDNTSTTIKYGETYSITLSSGSESSYKEFDFSNSNIDMHNDLYLQPDTYDDVWMGVSDWFLLEEFYNPETPWMVHIVIPNVSGEIDIKVRLKSGTSVEEGGGFDDEE